MTWVVWNGYLYLWVNSHFREHFKSIEDLEYEHNQRGVALWLLWSW